MKGRKFDSLKLPYDLLPMSVIDSVVRVQQFGRDKYGSNTWQKVKNGKKRYVAAAMRHVSAFQQGEWLDKESKLPHLTHALCSLMYAEWIDQQYRRRHKHEYTCP